MVQVKFDDGCTVSPKIVRAVTRGAVRIIAAATITSSIKRKKRADRN